MEEGRGGLIHTQRWGMEWTLHFPFLFGNIYLKLLKNLPFPSAFIVNLINYGFE